MKQYTIPTILIVIVVIIGLAGWAQKNTSSESTLPIGYIKDIYDQGGKHYIDVDEVQWLSRQEETCVMEAGQGVPQCNPKGFLIVNNDTEVITFEVAQKALITRTSVANPASNDQTIIDVATFTKLEKSHFDLTPYRIELRKGVAMSITEQQLP